MQKARPTWIAFSALPGPVLSRNGRLASLEGPGPCRVTGFAPQKAVFNSLLGLCHRTAEKRLDLRYRKLIIELSANQIYFRLRERDLSVLEREDRR